MKSFYLSACFKLFLLAADATTSMYLVSSYTFDPLNNSWKPSNTRRGGHRSHQSSSAASSYSYAPAEPTPSTGVEFTYNSDDIVRHHYTAFVGGTGDVDMNDPAFVPKQTLVEIQYNKRTGEVSLLDEEGVVTPEEYERLKKAIKFEEGGEEAVDGTTASEQRLQSQQREEDVAVGTTLYLDAEDLDLTDVIDTDSQDLAIAGQADTSSAAKLPRQIEEVPQWTQQLKDYPEPSVQWHESEDVDPSENFNSYSIPEQTTETNYPVQQNQQQYQHYQNSQPSQQSIQAMSGGNGDQSMQQIYQQPAMQQQTYSEYYPATAVAEQPAPAATEEATADEFDDRTYRSSRGFGFAHRRESFYGGQN